MRLWFCPHFFHMLILLMVQISSFGVMVVIFLVHETITGLFLNSASDSLIWEWILRDWGKLWLKVVPSKISLFVWVLARRRTLTIDNLKKQGYSLVDQCALGQCEDENIDHIFLAALSQSRSGSIFSSTVRSLGA